MPEIRECFMHYKHTHYVLVESLGLGERKNDPAWTLRSLWADATNAEASRGGKSPPPGLSKLHVKGYVDEINAKCECTRGQVKRQTMIWPTEMVRLKPGGPRRPVALSTLQGLVLQAISYTPRSLILKFGKLDLQVVSDLVGNNCWLTQLYRYPG
jgi:hypothetical protein